MEQYFREPFSAGIIAAAITMGYIYGKAKMNGQKNLKNSEYTKPAFLVGLLVYFIVSQGQGGYGRDAVTKAPF